AAPRCRRHRSRRASAAARPPCWRCTATSSMAPLLQERLVLLGRQELVPLGLVRGLDEDHPALAVGVRVHRLRLLRELGVGLDDLAGDGREEVGNRLDRLDDAEGLARRHLGADLRQLDEDDVAELLLGVRGDADAHAVALLLRPLVLARVLEVLRDARHRVLYLICRRSAFAGPPALDGRAVIPLSSILICRRSAFAGPPALDGRAVIPLSSL